MRDDSCRWRTPWRPRGLAISLKLTMWVRETYRGIKLSLDRTRSATGLSINGNYTLSHCEADTYFDGHWPNYNITYQDSAKPSFVAAIVCSPCGRWQCLGERADASLHEPGAECRRVGLAGIRPLQRALRQLADRHVEQ